MTGAENKKRLCGEASWMTEGEIAEGVVDCEAWIKRTRRYCERAVLIMGRDGWPSVDPDQAVGLLDP
jgi:hypothetical protein